MKNKKWIILGVILVMYAALALTYCSKQGYWHDEMHTFTNIKGISAYNFKGSFLCEVDKGVNAYVYKEKLGKSSFIDGFYTAILHEGHPPIYYITLKIWAICFGYSELSLRGFSVFCGVLSFIVFFKILLLYCKNSYTRWLTVSLMIFNPFLFYYFSEARMYALAFLLSNVCFYFYLRYIKQEEHKNLNFILFCISSAALFYTHYYGIFFYITLLFWMYAKNGFSHNFLRYFIPFILFAPWIFMVHAQLAFREVHWTDGAVSLLRSIEGYGQGIIKLLISPMSASSGYEVILVNVLIIVPFIFLCIRRKWKKLLIFLSIIIVYFSQIYIFDHLLDHHTILVPRYYIFILIILYWIIAKSFSSIPKILSTVVVVFYCIVSLGVIEDIFFLRRAPKQMYREVASYIDLQFSPDKTLIIAEPKGPIIWGLSYYLTKNFIIIAAEDFDNTMALKPLYVNEDLGVYYKSRINKKHKKDLEHVPFVGMSIRN